ncbi:MAG: SsrA-binding protein SmpB [Tidjanibacter sp.]|nr:SsrA-binding protein SmpB [Tidjanibacter sp.]
MGDYRNISVKNKKAYFNYEILEEFVAGIVLAGTEIKSLRLGKASMTDCYCYFVNHELFVRGMNIAEYDWGTYNNHAPRRDRKLLLTERELLRLERAVQDKGITIVGLRLFINERGLAKLAIGLARGKHEFDKRETIKKRDSDRELQSVRKSIKR